MKEKKVNNVEEESKTEVERMVDETIEETNEKAELTEMASVEDRYKLNQVALANSVFNASKIANTDNLECDYYSISLVSVVENNKILEIEEANTFGDVTISDMVDEYKDKYGQEIDIFVNFDGYTNDNQKYDRIGWTNVENVEKQMKICSHNNSKQIQKVKM